MHRVIVTQMPNSNFRDHNDYKFLNTVVLIVVLSMAWLLMFSFGVALEDPALRRGNLEQSLFFIDAYYYYYLGTQIKNLVSTGSMGLIEAVVELAPNPSTIGVVFISTMLSYLFDSLIQVNTFLFALFSILIIRLRTNGIFRRYSEFLLLGGLMPYLFSPSKECFFILGLLIYLTRYGAVFRWVPTITGITLMLLARPEGAIILIIVLALVHSINHSTLARFTVIIGVLAVYILFLREPLIERSILFEISAEVAGTHFCMIGPFSLCVADAYIPELVFMQRIFVSLFLPLDWLYDFIFLIINPDNFMIVDIYLRTATLFHIFLITSAVLFLWRWRKTKMHPLFIFTVVYFSIYTGFLFFQSTRQVIFITTILFILTRLRTDILKMGPPNKKTINVFDAEEIS